MEAYVWAATDSHLGVCISTRVFGSLMDAQKDAQEAIGDAVVIEWTQETTDEFHGEFVDSNGVEGIVRISLVKVSL